MTDLTALTLAEARDGLKAKTFSATELTKAHSMPSKRPTTRSTPTCCVTPERRWKPQAESDRRLAKGEARPLEGLPLGNKDLFCHQGRAHHRVLEDPRRFQADV